MYRQQLVAHRGYQKLYPENTLLGHQKAIDAGALYLETDIQLSADLEPVLYHEARLKRVSGCPGKVSDFTLNELIELPAHEPKRLGQMFADETITPLSSLVQLLAKHPEVTAYIEIKSDAIDIAGIEVAYEAMARYLLPIATRCYLFSYHYSFVKYARDRGWQYCGVILKKWRDLESPLVRSIQPDTVFCRYQKVPRNTRLDNIAPDVVLFEIAEPKLATYWLKRGATKIETFDVGGMITTMAHLTN